MAEITIKACDVCKAPDACRYHIDYEKRGPWQVDLCDKHAEFLLTLRKEKIGRSAPRPKAQHTTYDTLRVRTTTTEPPEEA